MDSINIKNNQVIVGVDIGGSHIASAMVEGNCLVEKTYFQTKIDSSAPSEIIIAGWIKNIRETLKSTPVSQCYLAIAMPGPFDYERGISLIKGMNKYESLYGLNIKQVFSEHLNISTSNIHFFNDARTFILGEAVVQDTFKNIIGITLGTGLGSAKCFNLIAEDVNRGSSPFLNGIVEDYLSTRWFVKRYHEITDNVISDVKSLCNLIGAEDIKSKIFKEFSNNLAQFLVEFIAFEAPEAVIIGGNIAKASNRFLPGVREQLAKKYPNVVLIETILGDAAALIGACALVKDMLPKA